MANAGKGYIGPEWTKLPKDKRRQRLAEVAHLVEDRESWHRLSLATKIPVDPLRRAYDKVWHKRRLDREKKYRECNNGNRVDHWVMGGGRPESSDVAARLAEIPQEDTRSLTGVLFGDPLPGRRALDLVKSQANYSSRPVDEWGFGASRGQ